MKQGQTFSLAVLAFLCTGGDPSGKSAISSIELVIVGVIIVGIMIFTDIVRSFFRRRGFIKPPTKPVEKGAYRTEPR